MIDVFAGPGGLSEGFSALEESPFRVVISIEMEKSAHKSLRLRSFVRQFGSGQVPSEYYGYTRGEIALSDLQRKYREEWEQAEREAWRVELGVEDHRNVRNRVDDALASERNKANPILVGGPPCQAYSLIGRSRMRPVLGAQFDSDLRHFLYREYLRILADHAPIAFVFENVKGLLSSTQNGVEIFERICRDLCSPGKALNEYKSRHPNVAYRLFPLTVPEAQSDKAPTKSKARCFVVRSEELGLPQARHRVIVVGIRRDCISQSFDRLGTLAKPSVTSNVSDVLGRMPELRSGLTRIKDSDGQWERTVRASADRILNEARGLSASVSEEIVRLRDQIETPPNGRGGQFVPCLGASPRYMPRWYMDKDIGGVLNHATRGHMPDDLARYLFVATYGRVEKRSPTLADFPHALLPNHVNVKWGLGGGSFADRFRVQLADRPCKTITAHISKDGHYYIHPEPAQCRSLTVREAARLQTFPDNYFFEGSRTQQYVQVGNAVPPLLARQIAIVIAEALGL